MKKAGTENIETRRRGALVEARIRLARSFAGVQKTCRAGALLLPWLGFRRIHRRRLLLVYSTRVPLKFHRPPNNPAPLPLYADRLAFDSRKMRTGISANHAVFNSPKDGFDLPAPLGCLGGVER